MKEDIIIGPAVPADIDEVLELIYMKPPSAWMRRISRGGMAKLMKYSMVSPRSVLLTARQGAEKTVAGCIYSISDPKRFWLVFALKNPAVMARIAFHHLKRVKSLNEEKKRYALKVEDNPHLPFFSWDPSSPANARIMFLFVRQEYRKKGIATKLYLKLFDVLKDRGCSKVEEHVGSDYLVFAGKFQATCGWQARQCRDGGYKIARQL